MYMSVKLLSKPRVAPKSSSATWRFPKKKIVPHQNTEYNKNANVRCSEMCWPCEFVGQSRSWTSLDQSACIWTQRAPSGTGLGCAHKSERERKTHTYQELPNDKTKVIATAGRHASGINLHRGLRSLWQCAGVNCPVSGVVFMANIPHSWVPVRARWPGPEENQAPGSWWGHAGCSARRPHRAHRRRGDPSAVPWQTNKQTWKCLMHKKQFTFTNK